MGIEARVFDRIARLFAVAALPEVGAIIARSQQEMPKSWHLPALACEALGGDALDAVRGVVAIACCQLSIILIDDLLDEDPRGEQHRIGAGSAANYASALQTGGIEAILESDLKAEHKLLAVNYLNHMMATTAVGQQQDLQNPDDEESYWAMVRAKSSPYFSAAFAVGALFGRVDAEMAGQMKTLGELYGEIVQIGDDLNDTLEVPAGPDWINGRNTLPILFAATVRHPQRERFVELRSRAKEPHALAEAQDIIIQCGAASYCLDQVLWRNKQAQQIVAEMSIHHPEALMILFEDSARPIWALLRALGEAQPEGLPLQYD